MNLDLRSEALLEGAHRYRVATGHNPDHVCAECRYAQLFAVQPRAVCQYPDSQARGRTLFAGQPACADFVAQRHLDLRLGTYTAVTIPSRTS